MERSARIGGLLFESWPRSYDRCYVISAPGIPGWVSGTPVRRDETSRPLGHGSFDSPGFQSARVVSWSGFVLAPAPADLEQMCLALSGLLAGGEMGRLVVDGEMGSLWADVRLAAQTQVTVVGECEAEYQVQFWAPDPRRYGERQSFSGANVSVFHYGNVGAVPVVTVQGPQSAPYMISSQGKSVTVTQSLSSDQVHRIDMGTGWVYRNDALQMGVTSALDLFTIPAGPSVTVAGPGGMTVTVADTFV